jgi:hypothetical protein
VYAEIGQARPDHLKSGRQSWWLQAVERFRQVALNFEDECSALFGLAFDARLFDEGIYLRITGAVTLSANIEAVESNARF